MKCLLTLSLNFNHCYGFLKYIVKLNELFSQATLKTVFFFYLLYILKKQVGHVEFILNG